MVSTLHPSRLLALATALLLLATPAMAAMELTLEHCLQAGMKRNPRVLSAELGIDETQEGIREASSAFLPTLSFRYNTSQVRNRGDAGQPPDNDEEDGEDGENGGLPLDPLSDPFDPLAGDPLTTDPATGEPVSETPVLDDPLADVPLAEGPLTGSQGPIESSPDGPEFADREPADPDAVPRYNYDMDGESFSITLTQELFSGFASLYGVDRAQLAHQRSRYELKRAQLELSRDIRQVFYAILVAGQRIAQWQGSVDRLERQQELVAAWVEQRLAPRLRLLEVGVELANARHELLRAQSEERLAVARMRQHLSVGPGLEMRFTGSLDRDFGQQCDELLACQELALAFRPEMSITQLGIAIAGNEAKSIVAQTMPKATLEGSWTNLRQSYVDDAFTDADRDFFTVMFNVTFTPFQGGREIFAWRKQKIVQRRLQTQFVGLRNNILVEVETRLQQLNDFEASVQNAYAALEVAREAYAVASRSAEMGVASLGEVLDAEMRLTRTEINHINSRHERVQARVQLLYALGN